MSFQNTVVALLAILVFATATHEMRSHEMRNPHGQAEAEDIADIRVVRIAKPMLHNSLSEPAQLAQVLGLQSQDMRELQRLQEALATSQDSDQAVLKIHGPRSDRYIVLVLE